MSDKFKLLIAGHGRHGKDTVCEILRDKYGYTFKSSSLYCAEHVVRPYLAVRGIEYDTIEDCYADRHNHRKHWFRAIADYNQPDLTKLSRQIIAEYDIYCGLRNVDELNACKASGTKVFDSVIWVDASERHPPESPESCSITADDADYILDNNGDLTDLNMNIEIMLEILKIRSEDAT